MNLEKGLINFIDASPTGYQAASNVKQILIENGYKELHEVNLFDLVLKGKYFVTRNDSAVIAFEIPSDISNMSINMCASHTDSPSFKIKPNNKITRSGYSSINTEIYGGPIISSWLDRPLSVAGRLLVKSGDSITTKLVNIEKDLLVIPNLPPHINHEINSGYKYNAQVDLLPLFSLDEKDDIISYIKKECGISGEILSHDLFLYPRFKGTLIGANKEMIMSSRLDDLMCVYGSLQGFIEAKNEDSLNVYIAFDNEEVGSRTKQGAAGTFLKDTLRRIFLNFGLSEDSLDRSLSKSLLVSADNAHACHPNLPGKFDELNRVKMNEGIVIKYNAANSYTTDALSEALFLSMCKKEDVKFQRFANRSDLRGGGTLGAISSSQLSIKSVDIGLAQLAMHSTCEVSGTKDLDYLVRAMKSFYSSTLDFDGVKYTVK